MTASSSPAKRGSRHKHPAEPHDESQKAVQQDIRYERHANNQEYDRQRGTCSRYEEYGGRPDVVPHRSEMRHSIGIGAEKDLLNQ